MASMVTEPDGATKGFASLLQQYGLTASRRIEI